MCGFLATAQEELQVLFKEVPQYNKFTLKRILMCLSKVVEESAENKMDAPNLATIFGPSFFRPPPSGQSTAPASFASDQPWLSPANMLTSMHHMCLKRVFVCARVCRSNKSDDE